MIWLKFMTSINEMYAKLVNIYFNDKDDFPCIMFVVFNVIKAYFIQRNLNHYLQMIRLILMCLIFIMI